MLDFDFQIQQNHSNPALGYRLSSEPKLKWLVWFKFLVSDVKQY